MRFVLPLVVACTMITTVRGATFVYVSKPAEQQIQIFRLIDENGELRPTAAINVVGTPGCLTTDATRQFLFASLRSTGGLASYRIDPVNGNLLPLSLATLDPAANSTFQLADPATRFLISASYTGGTVVVHGLTDGILSEAPLQTIPTARTAHCVSFDRTGTWVFVPHVAPNAVFQFRYDPAVGLLTPAAPIRGGAPGAGPRHIAWHPTLPIAYTSNETGNSITAYGFDPAAGLTPLETLTTLPDGFAGKNTTAEVKVHPTGRYVWVSNRGDDSLAGFTIDEAGKLAPIGHASTEKTPRSFDIDASGKYIFSAGEGSGRVAVFSVDQSTGRLSRIHTYDVGKSAMWVMAVDLTAP